METLNKFEKDCAEDLKISAKEVAKEARKKLKDTSPKGKGKKHYKDGWSIANQKESAYRIGLTIHNNKKPGLTHLLEKSHALRNGGRSTPIEHIGPVEEWCKDEFEKRTERRIKQ